MGGEVRIIGWISLFIGLIFLLVFQGSLDPVSRIASSVVLLSILTVLMFTGNQKISTLNIPKEISPIVSLDPTPIPDIPAPINQLESVSDKRDDKLRRSRRRAQSPVNPLPPMPLPAMPLPPNPVSSEMVLPPIPNLTPQAADGTKLAKKLVITSDAQSSMESEIEAFVDERRARQAEIRSSLERKRRMALAERRAAKARLWTEVEDGEDLATLLKDPNHGLTIIDEPEFPDESKPLGVSYIRIDNTRILKLKTPLEVASKEKETIISNEVSQDVGFADTPPPPGLPPMPPLPGLPPMPPPPGLPPMPPPPGMQSE